MKELTNIEGYVIRISPYKDNDAMVSVLTEDGIVDFSARGIKKTTSKNAQTCAILHRAKFSLLENSGLKTLKESELVKASPFNNSFENAISLSLIGELSGLLINKSDANQAFIWLKTVLEAIESGFDPLTSALVYFAQLMKINGYGLNVSSCVFCGSKKQIVGIDYAEGGFVCNDCISKNTVIYEPSELRSFRFAFLVSPNDLTRATINTEICYKLIKDLSVFLEDVLGFHLKSAEMLKMLTKYESSLK